MATPLGRSLAYAHRYLYRCVPDEYLEWSHRWGCILRELDTVRPDVVCMQEVEVPVLAQIQADMAARGYEGRYSKRADPREDGCGTFWRRDALKLIDQRAISFQALDLRENTALVLAFETRDSWGGASGHLRDPERRVLVGNTHVLFNPRSGCTKVAQVRVLMNAVAAMRERLGGCPACVCGDFNAAPGSPIYQFSRDGELRCAAYDRRRMSGQLEGAAWGWPRGLGKILREESDAGVFKAEGGGVISLSAASGNAASTCEQGREERTSSDSGTWADEQIDRACGSPEEEADLLGAGGVGRGVARHALAGALASTYAAVLGREPKYTSCHSQFFGALDYMWFTKAGAGAAGLTPLRVLLPPPPESLEVGLPDANWGSDHCSIAADFAIAGARGRL
ncbi:unnamed protein product [Pedinophyceae sp. YPF-701]|nr:unnamed protein product [Pedinophyceae sp. YPF-701]